MTLCGAPYLAGILYATCLVMIPYTKRSYCHWRNILGHTNLNNMFLGQACHQKRPGWQGKKINLNLIFINAKFKQNHNTII